MLAYPVTLERDGKGYLAYFPDIPEALTSGDTKEEALEMARDALETAMDFYFDDRRQVPPPSKPKRGQDVVSLPATTAAKVLLLNEMLRQRVTPADLARRMHASPQSVNRLVNLKYSTKIDAIEEA